MNGAFMRSYKVFVALYCPVASDWRKQLAKIVRGRTNEEADGAENERETATL